MLKIDEETMWISMTRADSENIVFGAKNKAGEDFHPTKNDRIIFSAAKKVGDEPLIVIMNEMNNDEEAFWNIRFNPEHTENLPFGKYAYDVQIETRSSTTGSLQNVDTIIGKTDTLSPTLVLWGEVSKESE